MFSFAPQKVCLYIVSPVYLLLLEALSWHFLGDRVLCIAVLCPPKFTKSIVFILLCLFSNVPSALRSSIWEKEHCCKKVCGQKLFLFIFSLTLSSQNQTLRKGFGYRWFIGEAVLGSTKREWAKWDKERRKANNEYVNEQVTLWAAGTQFCWNSLRNCVEHVSILPLENRESVIFMHRLPSPLAEG